MPALPPEPLGPRATATDGARLTFHGTAVAVDGKGVLILGPSGSGKSSLALALIAQGAQLISDDTVWLEAATLSRPETVAPLIEARGIGLLHAGPLCPQAPLSLVIDLSRAEPDRLPSRRQAQVGATTAPLILAAGQPTLAPAVLHLLRYGQAFPDL